MPPLRLLVKVLTRVAPCCVYRTAKSARRNAPTTPPPGTHVCTLSLAIYFSVSVRVRIYRTLAALAAWTHTRKHLVRDSLVLGVRDACTNICVQQTRTHTNIHRNTNITTQHARISAHTETTHELWRGVGGSQQHCTNTGRGKRVPHNILTYLCSLWRGAMFSRAREIRDMCAAWTFVLKTLKLTVRLKLPHAKHKKKPHQSGCQQQ